MRHCESPSINAESQPAERLDNSRRTPPPQLIETPSQFPLCENGCPSNMENAEKDVLTSRDGRPLVRFSGRLARIECIRLIVTVATGPDCRQSAIEKRSQSSWQERVSHDSYRR